MKPATARPKLWALVFTFCFLVLSQAHLFSNNPQTPPGIEFKEVAKQIKNLGLREEKAYDFLKILISVGGRLTGSPEADRAVELAFKLMTELGFDRVKKEPVQVNRWVRGKTERAILFSQKFGKKKLNICAFGNSVATPPGGLRAGVVEVQSFTELAKKKEKVRGRVVFYNVAMDRTILEPFAAYGQAARFRVNGASEAARHGAVASLLRSLTFRVDSHPHTGMMVYDENYPQIPAVALSTEDAELLTRWLEEDENLQIELELDCEHLSSVVSANVFGQITGLEKPEEIILLGGHIDSWDLGHGAHDDGAGCAVAIEALRLILVSGLKPKRTIRAVLFMDEEFGGTGGRAYALSEERENETLSPLNRIGVAFYPWGWRSAMRKEG